MLSISPLCLATYAKGGKISRGKAGLNFSLRRNAGCFSVESSAKASSHFSTDNGQQKAQKFANFTVLESPPEIKGGELSQGKAKTNPKAAFQ